MESRSSGLKMMSVRGYVQDTSSCCVSHTVLYALTRTINKSEMVSGHVELAGGKQQATYPYASSLSSQDRQDLRLHKPMLWCSPTVISAFSESLLPFALPSSPFFPLFSSDPGSETSPFAPSTLSDNNNKDNQYPLLSTYCMLATGVKWCVGIISFKSPKQSWPYVHMFIFQTPFLLYSTCQMELSWEALQLKN